MIEWSVANGYEVTVVAEHGRWRLYAGPGEDGYEATVYERESDRGPVVSTWEQCELPSRDAAKDAAERFVREREVVQLARASREAFHAWRAMPRGEQHVDERCEAWERYSKACAALDKALGLERDQ